MIKNNLSKSQIGIFGATSIVVGNMMGSGISLLAASLSAIGSITIIINSVLMTILTIVLMIISFIKNQSAITTFSETISLAVLLTILPYLYNAIFMIKAEGVNKKTIMRFLIAIIACIFCFLALVGSNEFELEATLILSLICFILYAIKKSKNTKKEV